MSLSNGRGRVEPIAFDHYHMNGKLRMEKCRSCEFPTALNAANKEKLEYSRMPPVLSFQHL